MTTNARSKEFVDGLTFLDDTETKGKSSIRPGTGLNDPSCISPFSNRVLDYPGVSEASKMHVSLNPNASHYYIQQSSVSKKGTKTRPEPRSNRIIVHRSPEREHLIAASARARADR
jgi:hypothetical protein